MNQYARTERSPLGGDYTAALDWFDRQLAAHGLTLAAPVELAKERDWATVFRAETSGGVLWLKLSGAGTRFEVGLYDLMHRIAPEHVLEPLALDVDRAWIVLPDGGPLLADQTDAERLPGQLEQVFAQYAELQLAVAGHTDELLRIGVTDMRAEIMPERFDEALAFVVPYLGRRGTEPERAAYEHVSSMHGQIAEWCARLAAAPGLASIDHNDLHPWNVFYVEGPGGVQSTFYDWGDAVLAHPFASMLIGLGAPKRLHGWADDDPRMLRMRDAYLEPFAAWGSRAELVETLELSCRVGQIARALVWARAVGEAGASAPDTYQTAPMEYLANLLHPSHLGA
ncbi:MAG: phosphotransferase [Actinomycetales bacterium]